MGHDGATFPRSIEVCNGICGDTCFMAAGLRLWGSEFVAFSGQENGKLYISRLNPTSLTLDPKT